MTPDPQSTLQLAFKHLDAFGMQGIGLFKRVRVLAQIDHQHKRIQPPRERFVIEQGEEGIHEFENFVFRWFDLKMGDAVAFVQSISAQVQHVVQTEGHYRIEGIGTIRKDDEGAFEFVEEPGIFGQTADFFGLQAVEYNVGESVKPSLEKKKEAVAQSVRANTTVVEPVCPRKKFPMGWLIFFLLLLVGAGAVWNWQVEVKEMLTKAGFIQQDRPTSSTPAKDQKREDSLRAESIARAKLITDSLTILENHLKDSMAALASTQPHQKPATQSRIPDTAPKHSPSEPKAKLPSVSVDMALNDGKYGVRPENGHYYLVISSNEDGAEAAATASGIPGSKVLVPYFQKGFYKLSVFESTSKQQVIDQMVKLKAKYPKSWIFWPGMPIYQEQ